MFRVSRAAGVNTVQVCRLRAQSLEFMAHQHRLRTDYGSGTLPQHEYSQLYSEGLWSSRRSWGYQHLLEEYDVAELGLAFRQVPDQWVDQREPG